MHFQGRRERFIKPAIPLPNIGLNTSAPNVLSSSIIPSSHHSQSSNNINNFNYNNNNNNGANSGSNVSLSSLNNSSSTSSSTLPSQSSGNISAFVQPPSPMMD